jgi:hypothetical protein
MSLRGWRRSVKSLALEMWWQKDREEHGPGIRINVLDRRDISKGHPQAIDNHAEGKECKESCQTQRDKPLDFESRAFLAFLDIESEDA